MRTAICPGSFDPITLGHLDIIKRSAGIFDRVVVLVIANPQKKAMFSLDERVELISRVIAPLQNVSVQSSAELLSRFAEKMGECVVVKGLRAISDFESEFQMALINRNLNKELETVFLPTSEAYLYLSSSIVKEVGGLNGDISAFVPSEILQDVYNKLNRGQSDGQRN